MRLIILSFDTLHIMCRLGSILKSQYFEISSPYFFGQKEERDLLVVGKTLPQSLCPVISTNTQVITTVSHCIPPDVVHAPFLEKPYWRQYGFLIWEAGYGSNDGVIFL
jgi:hypothetical protein